MTFGTHDKETAKFLDAVAEHDIRATAGHVRRNGYRTLLAGILDDLSFLFMILRIEHVMLDAMLLQNGTEFLRLRD